MINNNQIKAVLYTAIVLVSIIGCNAQTNKEKNRNEQVQLNEKDVIKIYVNKNGLITANGNHIALPELDKELEELKNKNGTVYYSRDDIANNSPEESMKVMELIVKYKLPMKFYTDQTFTTPVKLN